MKIVEDIYNDLLKRKDALEEERKEVLNLRETAAEAGDLRENADYIKACSDLERLNIEYNRIMKMLDDGYPIPVSTEFSTIDIGSKFHLTIRIKTSSNVTETQHKDIGVFSYDSNGNEIVFQGIAIIAGDMDDKLKDGYMSSESIVGRALIGKPLGNHMCTNLVGELLELEVRHA